MENSKLLVCGFIANCGAGELEKRVVVIYKLNPHRRKIATTQPYLIF